MFHPIVQSWFDHSFSGPTPCQSRAWPAIRKGMDVLISAPTGSGKTFAAFLSSIDELATEAIERNGLPDETRVLYVSPLKALSNDIEKNLRHPLSHVNEALLDKGIPWPINAAVRTGDTPAGERTKMVRKPPHILVTTPESLFILLTSESGRAMLSTVRSVIIDEIHALAANKRGAHLTLSLERLAELTSKSPVRVGLSATQNPLSRVAEFLSAKSADANDVLIVDEGVHRDRDLEVMLPDSPLEAIMSAEVWGELYTKICGLIEHHRTTLIFVNTRRHAERIAHQLAERLGEDAVTSHHGSLSRQHRHNAEQRLKNGELRALVATASLELGIDIGDVDLVCQLGSPKSASVLLQRVGRSGHGLGRVPKGRLFPLSRDDLVECAALVKCSRDGELDELIIPDHPLDVLSQQIVAETANREWQISDLFAVFKRARPYHHLQRSTFDETLKMLGEGFSTRRGRRSAHIHLDLVNGRVKGRKGARLTALTNGGAIPDLFDYEVVMEPEGTLVGTLNEDFAFESLAGDIFQLGNTSYQILRVEKGVVRVIDAKGQPPNIPFWFGEAPGRGDSLSFAVSRLREEMDDWLATAGEEHANRQLIEIYGLDDNAAGQLTQYLSASWKAFGERLPTAKQLIAERFFDEAGDMHLVIHSTYGSRLNRAFGLALRKRFCRRFNFELQAAALEDCIVLSLGETHSFDIAEVANYLNSTSVKEVLTQALLDAPVFPTHWRWVTNIALAVRRFSNGKKVPAQFQRSDAEDLVAVVFPDQLACFENIQGEREIPQHPLVDQALWDCLHGVMDVTGLANLLKGMESGEISWIGRDMIAPSPLAEEVLNAKPYAFLDDAPAEERRTLAVQSRGVIDEGPSDYSRLDPQAILKVCEEAWPEVNSPDELHDALVCGGFIARKEVEDSHLQWQGYFEELVSQRRATPLQLDDGPEIWVAAERLYDFQCLEFEIKQNTCVKAISWNKSERLTPEQAMTSILRSRLEISGPVTLLSIAMLAGFSKNQLLMAVTELQQQGFAIKGSFRQEIDADEWCDRRLLARIHRYTLKTLRAQIEPVSLSAFMRFLFEWQHVDPTTRLEGPDGTAEVISQLEGFGAPLKSWESDILPTRIYGYSPALLDQIGMSGRIQWRRHHGWRSSGNRPGSRGLGNVSVGFYAREDNDQWLKLETRDEGSSLASSPQALLNFLEKAGACYFDDLVDHVHMLPTQIEEALSELIARGLVTCDGFNGFRALLLPQSKRRQSGRSLQRRHRRLSSTRIEQSGRWSLINSWQLKDTIDQSMSIDDELLDVLCDVLLHRYGIVCRAICDHERGLPPWRMILPYLRRLEARGEVRGGRFIAKLQGEQFALPEAVKALRRQRDNPKSESYVRISSADPLNLTGGILATPRVGQNHTLLFRNGILVAHEHKRKIEFIAQESDQQQWKIREKLLVSSRGSALPRTRVPH